MPRDEAAVHRIAVLAYEAATEPAKWNDVVRAIAASADATGAALFTRQSDPDWRALASAWGSTADAMQPYLQSWAADDPWERAIAQNHMFRIAGEVRGGSEMLPCRNLRRTAFYNDFARQHELEVLVALKICDGIDATSPITQIALFRPPGAEEFSDRDRQYLTALWPHLHRAVRTCWLLRQTRTADSLAEDVLDHLPEPAWVLKADAKIVFANAAARRLEATESWLKTRAGTLAAIGDFESGEILAALKCADIGGGRTWIATLGDGRGMCRSLVRVAPIKRDSVSAVAWLQAHAILTLELPASGCSLNLWLARLAKRCQLTPAERRVLQELAKGSTLPEISQEIELSYATVRSHVQSIFSKTGCRRQAELAQLLAGGRIVDNDHHAPLR